MKISNEEARISVEVMQILEEKGKLGYAIAKNLRKLKTEITEYVDFRNNLIVKFGKKEANGNYTLTKEKIPEFVKELGDLPNEKVEVDVYTIPEEVFCSGSLTSQQMEILLWMVEA